MARDSAPGGRDTIDRMLSLDSFEGITTLEPPLQPGWLSRLPGGELANAVYPGVVVAATIALAATWLSQNYHAPVMLFGLLIGMTFHFLHEDGRCVAGIEFASRSVLRVGVGLLGARVTAGQIAGLGLLPVLMVVASVGSTILLGTLLARRFGQNRVFGILSGGAVAICGASAALAIASVLPRRGDSERDTIFTVVAVTGLSTLAMIVYPLLVGLLRLDHVQAGLFLGGTIHDVAQVIGAGLMISPETGDIATYVKLLRVMMLLPVVSLIAWRVARHPGAGSRRAPPVPLFLAGFAVLVLVNSGGLLPPSLTEGLGTVSRWCLVTAIAALGMKTSFKSLAGVGWRPLALLLIETLWILLLVLATVRTLM